MSSPPPSSSHCQDDQDNTTTFPSLQVTSGDQPTHEPQIPTTSFPPADSLPFQFDDFYEDDLALLLEDNDDINIEWPWQSHLPIQHDHDQALLLGIDHHAHDQTATATTATLVPSVVDRHFPVVQQSGEASSSTKQSYEAQKMSNESGQVMMNIDKSTSITHDDDKVQQRPSGVKKLDHNAKERVRRLKLNNSYMALGSLLPDSEKPKKKWSEPYMIDRAIEYIPELEGQVKKLTTKKDEVSSTLQQERNHEALNPAKSSAECGRENQAFTVSVNEVKRGEVIIQICRPRDEHSDNIFSKIIEKVEDEGMTIVSVSSLTICNDRCSYHLHVEMSETSLGDNTNSNYIRVLQDKIVLWLHY